MALLAGWLPSPSSPTTRFTLRSQLVLVTVFLGIALFPRMFLKSGARRFPGSPPVTRLAPKPLGSGSFLRQQATVVLSCPLRRPWAVRFFSFVVGGLLKGFFAPVRLYVGFLRVWHSYAFLPIGLGWWLVCG